MATHSDATQMTRTPGGMIYVQGCDPAKGGRSFGGGRGVSKADRAAAEAFYRESRDNHERVCEGRDFGGEEYD